MKVKELIAQLQQCDPEALVIFTLWNGWTDTYCAMDHVSQFTSEQLFNDFFGTLGETDDRVWDGTTENVVCISSLFEYNPTVIRDKHDNLKPDLDFWHQED